MSVFTGIARFSKDSVDGVVDAFTEVKKGTVEITSGVLSGELSLLDAAKKGTGHSIAAGASLISPGKFISLATEATDSSLLGPLAEFKEVLYGGCDDKIKKADMELSLMLLVILQKLSPTPFPEIEEYQAASNAIFANFKHWMNHATAAYGRTPLIHPASYFVGCKDDKAWITHMTGVSTSDILKYEDAKEVADKPWLEYYLAVDRAKSAVVLAVKGTLSIKGAMTDLRCDYVSRDGYKYHRGIFEASEALIEHIKGDITRALEANPDFSLVTCGHSLGGGVAALVAHLLSKKLPDGRFVMKTEGRYIHCYALEPAASMCAQASADYQELISSLVHKNDIVPALSEGVIKDIKAYAIYLQEHRDYLGEVLFNTAQMMAGFGDSKKADEYLETFRSVAKNEKLVPPGMVYIMGKKERLRFGRVGDVVVAKYFGEARFIMGMIEHHIPLSIMKTFGNFK